MDTPGFCPIDLADYHTVLERIYMVEGRVERTLAGRRGIGFEPLEERRLVWSKPHSRQALGETFSLEVSGREDKRLRLDEPGRFYPLALP